MNTKPIDAIMLMVPGFAFLADMASFENVVVMYVMCVTVVTFMMWRE